MTLTGILKNVILVFASVLIWTTPITLLQLFGYVVALGGLVWYSLGWDQIKPYFTGYRRLGGGSGAAGSSRGGEAERLSLEIYSGA